MNAFTATLSARSGNDSARPGTAFSVILTILNTYKSYSYAKYG